MNRLQEISQQYLDGLITPDEFIVETVRVLNDAWFAIKGEGSAEAIQLVNQLSERLVK